MPSKDFWKVRGIPNPIPELMFYSQRAWRFDFAWPDRKIALEVEGGTWMRGQFGGHNRGSGMARDMAKYNHATRLGWKVYRVTPQQLNSDMPIDKYPKRYKGERESTSEFLRSLFQVTK